MNLVYLVFLCLPVYAFADVSQLVQNPKSTAFSDVQSITHDTVNREVVIQLVSSRKCENPTFIVRLSGPSLYTLDISEVSDESYYFNYPVLVDKGRYFLEVLLLYCKKIEPNTFKELCVENVKEGDNIINLPYSFEVQTTPRSVVVTQSRGRWVYAPWQYNYVPTRLPDGQHKDYIQWDFFSYIDGRLLHRNLVKAVALLNSTAPYTINVCMVGTSQAVELIDPDRFINFDLTDNVRFLHVLSQQPSDLNVTKVFEADCGYVVLDYGDDLFRGTNVPTIESYLTEMRALIKRLSRPEYQGPMQFFVRSMHNAPLSEQVISCPPTDFRTPPIASMINAQVKAIAQEHGIGFIDLSRVLAPMWDTTRDGVHFVKQVYYAEIAWIVNDVLEYSVNHHRAPHVDPGLTSIPNNTPVRYQEDRQVFLYIDGKLRGFPDGHTFVAMGYDFDNVIVLKEWKRKYQAWSMSDFFPHH